MAKAVMPRLCFVVAGDTVAHDSRTDIEASRTLPYHLTLKFSRGHVPENLHRSSSVSQHETPEKQEEMPCQHRKAVSIGTRRAMAVDSGEPAGTRPG
ncbi:MAG: hypothetical protein VB138_09635 [Burkholderia sp.]